MSYRDPAKKKAYQREYWALYKEKNREKIAAKNRAYYQANRERAAEISRNAYRRNRVLRATQQRIWAEANRKKAVAYTQRWQARNPEKARLSRHKANLKANFGLSKEDYDAMLTGQNHACAICFEPSPKRRLAVDHDHETGKIRALLCGRCNLMLGYSRERVDVLHTALEYLVRHHVPTC